MRVWSLAKVRLRDAVWLVVAGAGGIGAVVAGVGLIEALVQGYLQDGSAASRLATAGFSAAGLMGALWITAGAWRRTSWGCRLPPGPEGECVRHGEHCNATPPTRAGTRR